MLRRLPILILIALFLSYAGLHLFLYIVQRKMLYFPQATKANDRDALESLNYKEVSHSGQHLGWLREHFQAEASIFIFHGNATSAPLQAEWINPLYELPLNIVVVEYPGYTFAKGRPSMESIYDQSRKMVDHIHKRYPNLPFIFMGESLGGGPASKMTREYQDKTKACILIATFTSVAAVAKKAYPFVLGLDYLIVDNFDNLQNLKALKTPLLVIHGDQDKTIPHEMGQELIQNYEGPKKIFLIAGAGHGDSLPRYEPQGALWTPILEFLRDRALTTSSGPPD